MKKITQIWQYVNLTINTWTFRRRLHRIIIEGRKAQQPVKESYKLFLFYRTSIGL